MDDGEQPSRSVSLSHFTVVQRFIFADIIFIVSHTCREQKEGRLEGAVAAGSVSRYAANHA